MEINANDSLKDKAVGAEVRGAAFHALMQQEGREAEGQCRGDLGRVRIQNPLGTRIFREMGAAECGHTCHCVTPPLSVSLCVHGGSLLQGQRSPGGGTENTVWVCS